MTRYDNCNESEEDEPYANYKTNELNLPVTTSPTDKPSVQQLMKQMALIQQQLATLQAQLPPKQPAIQEMAQSINPSGTPAGQENDSELINTSKQEAMTAHLASEPPTSTQGKAAKATEDSKQKRTNKACEVESGHQNG